MANSVPTSSFLPPPPSSGIRSRLAEQVLRRIMKPIPVSLRLPDGQVWGSPDPALPRFQVLDKQAFFSRLGQSPLIGLGESYMAGEWAPAPGTDLADGLEPFAARLTSLIKPFFYRLRHAIVPQGLNPANTLAGSKRNIEAHYDLSNELFQSFLDPSLSYSSALFSTLTPPPQFQDLEPAQEQKIKAILDAAGVQAGSRVLEVGTGWGSLAIRAAERGAKVLTVTLSEEQAALAISRVSDAGLSDSVEVRVQDYREVQGTFDAIVSVEMVEAVGEEYWPEYFSKLDSLLAPGGKLSIQAILMSHQRLEETRTTYTWIHKYIFPGGMLPSLEALRSVASAHTSLKPPTVRFMGPDYAHTLRLWREEFKRNEAQVRGLGFDSRFTRMWEFYLAYCEAGFRTGYLDVAQVTFSR